MDKMNCDHCKWAIAAVMGENPVTKDKIFLCGNCYAAMVSMIWAVIK